MKKPGFTIEEHREVGRDLRQMLQALVQIEVRLCACYGKTKPVSHRTTDAVRAIDALCSKLDDAVCREHPLDDSVLSCYYGAPASRGARKQDDADVADQKP